MKTLASCLILAAAVVVVTGAPAAPAAAQDIVLVCQETKRDFVPQKGTPALTVEVWFNPPRVLVDHDLEAVSVTVTDTVIKGKYEYFYSLHDTVEDFSIDRVTGKFYHKYQSQGKIGYLHFSSSSGNCWPSRPRF